MKAPLLLFAFISLFATSAALAEDHSCSEPAQYCSSIDGGNIYMEACSVTCAEGVRAICVQGELVETTGRPPCFVRTENHCSCSSGEARPVQKLGDHE